MSNPNDGIIAAYADTLSLAGGTMTGPIAMGGNKISGQAAGSAPADSAQLQQAYRSQMEYYCDGAPAFLRSNLHRSQAVADLTALSTGVMTSVAILLYAGDVVTNLSFASGATAANTPTHWWFALYDTSATPALAGQSADQTSAAWAASTTKTLALAAPYAVTTTGIHYAAVMVAAATPPSLVGASVNTVASGAVIAGMKVLARTSGSSLAATAPATIATPSTVGTTPYVVIT